jgi:drug/metabolite transporter (DMT)-like permease
MYLSVVYIQMMKALTVLVVYCTSCALGVDLFRRGTVGRLCIVTAGVLLASYGETHFSLIGVVLQIGSIVSESLRLVLSQKLMQAESKKSMSSVDMMYHISPRCHPLLASWS